MNPLLESILTNPFFHLVAIIAIALAFILFIIYWHYTNKKLLAIQDTLALLPKDFIDVFELNLLTIVKLVRCYENVLIEKELKDELNKP